MSTGSSHDVQVAVVGAGVVGCAVALALARRGAAVSVLEAEPEPGLAASGTNSGILHTGFDAAPGELEAALIVRSQPLRAQFEPALGLPIMRCGARVRPRDEVERQAVCALADRARSVGADVIQRADGELQIPGESVTDPVLYTLALAAAAQRHGAELLVHAAVVAIERQHERLRIVTESGEHRGCDLVVNCAGLGADSVARLAGDDSFAIYPRKGEFLVFDPPDGATLEQILLPVPSERTKGVLVFPTLDGKVIAGPTAIDLQDKRDWSVRPEAREEILAKAVPVYPPLADAEQIGAYAGLRPAGRGVNYVISASGACDRLINVAAIRSTGLSASLGIAEHVAEIVSAAGVALGTERVLLDGPLPAVLGPWWRRTAEYRTAAV